MKKSNPLKLILVKDAAEGVEIVKNLLYKKVNKKTALFLSGGKTPKELYSELAQEEKINPGAVALIDERVGEILHENSNEKMIEKTGFLSYLEKNKIPFYSILRLHLRGGLRLHLKGAASNYNERVKHLLGNFSKKIAIMGIGEDGHTASLPVATNNLKLITNNYVDNINNFPGEFRERITLTFKALEEMDLLTVLVFGSAKQKALRLMFKRGPLEEIPSRFYTKPEIANKTLLITDQKV